jgi:hypothetical protein
MPGKNLHLTPLESRKQLLLVESELNRAQLLNELRDLNNEIHHFKSQVQAAGALVSSAAKLATTFSAIGNAFTHREAGENKKSSWLSTLINGARTGATIWGAIRSQIKK